jgi:hypothetical protein
MGGGAVWARLGELLSGAGAQKFNGGGLNDVSWDVMGFHDMG